MVKLVNFTAGLGFAALLLAAACATNPPLSPEESAQGQARLSAISRLPDCASAQTITADRTAHIPDCRLKAGPSGLHLVVTSDPVEFEMLGPSGFVSVSVTNRRGQSIGDFAEITHGLYAYPEVHDANGDGLQDVVIPRSVDGMNVTYSLWLQQKDGDFAHAGEVSGSQMSWASGGMVTAAQRVGVSDWTVGYYSIGEAGKLQEVALVKGAGSQPPKRGGRCEVVRIAKGAKPGRFCSTR
ncbi:putative lipoprotein [Hyphomonas neptunium ATCC 15444]|uniref:Putative lipoprotein n=2 Tax=Hyphomonas TaxID=85 RepID=Q0BYY6_HYPNA|nr:MULTISPECIES: VCBS repeat-containing protein [Hyphomonas]ABI77841.1 putative lipoprotein [Hyphomonas neptunium ATCC 15444]KCZ87302.1 putative lipoprotein [Hyphomonas hirschiana VP5]